MQHRPIGATRAPVGSQNARMPGLASVLLAIRLGFTDPDTPEIVVSSPIERPVMRFDRNRYFMLGVILLLLGFQFRLVDSFVLNETSTRALHKVLKTKTVDANSVATNVFMQTAPSPKKTLRPPRWLGFVLLTAGGIIALHALVLPKSNS
jgi:hypothetical protein